MANSFTRILAKKLCRVVICSPPTGAQLGSELGQPSDEDPRPGLDHDHRYAGRPLSPVLKRFKSELCSGKPSCVCLHCLTPTLEDGADPQPLSLLPASASPEAVPVVAHSSEAELRRRVKSEGLSGSEGATPSPASSPSSSAATDYRLTNAFQCRLCDFRSQRLREYMEHVSSEHAFSGLISFKCHFCPEKFPSYALLVEHSKRYMERIGAGLTPLPDPQPSPDHHEIAAITLH